MFRKYFLPLIVFILYRTLSATWRVRLIEPDNMVESLNSRQPILLAHWHGDELVLLSTVRRYRVATIASQSKDGELMAKILGWMGARTSRGSSTRGGVQALKGLIRLLRDGGACSFAVDGPKGPIYKVKPGIFEIARMISAPIFSAGVSCDRAWHFPRSWNKTFLPKPFAKVVIIWTGPAPEVPKDADPRNPDLALALEGQLHKAKQEAFKFIADNKS